MARMTPALYHLLPSFDGALAVDDGMHADIFHPDAWQPNVARTIERQVEGWDIAGSELFQQMLDEARGHRERISGLVLRDESDWLAIAGVDTKTRVALRVRGDDDGLPRFDLRSTERLNDWDADDSGAKRNTGDGTVPLAGAIPPFMDARRLVCVKPGDFGYWELRDRTLSGLAGLHGALPRMNMLHRLILRFLLGKADPYGNTWGRRVPGVSAWEPPLELREKP